MKTLSEAIMSETPFLNIHEIVEKITIQEIEKQFSKIVNETLTEYGFIVEQNDDDDDMYAIDDEEEEEEEEEDED
jgi:hypothetical protein